MLNTQDIKSSATVKGNLWSDNGTVVDVKNWQNRNEFIAGKRQHDNQAKEQTGYDLKRWL